MEIIQCENIKEHRDKLIEVKQIDTEFTYNEEKEELFFFKVMGKIYGYAILDLNSKNNEKVIPILKKIFIEPKLRNNGYGTFLLNGVINWLIKHNYDKVIVLDHKKMNNFLEKQNFIKTENGYELLNLDKYKKEEKTLLFVSKFAILVNIILATLKIVAGKIFYSASLLSDGLNSLSDLITNVIVILGLKVGQNPEDKEHPFGHGKIESVFSVIIGTFIMVTAFNMLQENITNIINKQNIRVTPLVIVITIIALLIKLFQFIFMKYKVRNYKGALIKSLLKDYKMDIVITTSVVAGIFLSRINPIFDTLIGSIVALYIMKEGYGLIKENALILLDSQDEELLEEIKSDISELEDVKNAHDFRMTTSGKDIFINMDIRVEKNITVDEAHEITNKISKLVKSRHKNVKDVVIHVEPVYNVD